MKKAITIFALALSASVLLCAQAFAADEKGAAGTAETTVVKDASAKAEAAQAERVSPKDIYEKVQTGEILLVCAYPDDEKFAQNHLKGAISFKQFESQIKDAGQSKLIVFY